MFDVQASEKLDHYVYALFHPANPSIPFYIGKGSGNRVYAHASGDLAESTPEDEPMSPKLELIAEIKRNGGQVLHKIIRWKLLENEALAVEASLIDLVNFMQPETLTNQVSGQGSAQGIIDADELAFEFAAPELCKMLGQTPVLLIKICQRWPDLKVNFGAATAVPKDEIYKAVRGNWWIKISRAKNAHCILAIGDGLVRAAFVAQAWTSVENGRKAFDSDCAPTQFEGFVGKSVNSYFARGNQNPVRYLNC